jgi:hypothetical protein
MIVHGHNITPGPDLRRNRIGIRRLPDREPHLPRSPRDTEKLEPGGGAGLHRALEAQARRFLCVDEFPAAGRSRTGQNGSRRIKDQLGRDGGKRAPVEVIAISLC